MHYILSLSFDVEKPGDPLGLTITDEVGGPAQQIDCGSGGGAYLFQKDDVLELAVSASAATTAAAQFRISSLVMAASMPARPAGKRLSPFNKFDACAVVKEWGLPNVVSIRDIQDVTTISALLPLTVTAKNGQWNFAGSLSVLIEQARGKARPRCYPFEFAITLSA